MTPLTGRHVFAVIHLNVQLHILQLNLVFHILPKELFTGFLYDLVEGIKDLFIIRKPCSNIIFFLFAGILNVTYGRLLLSIIIFFRVIFQHCQTSESLRKIIIAVADYGLQVLISEYGRYGKQDTYLPERFLWLHLQGIPVK